MIAIRNQIQLPVKFVGIGEGPEDIEPFDPERFVEALFTSVDTSENAEPTG